ncbi:MAG: hypothetical protein HPQ69_04555 [Marine Group I thaumarchaeote]|jgi:hypothetical protein|nr:MAG: hypothetical protein HPQ69_04555 [Marine Group I thaumarchaeote]
MKQCNGICKRLEHKSINDSTAGSKGYRPCKVCDLCLLAGEPMCPCCSNILRVRSKSGRRH